MNRFEIGVEDAAYPSILRCAPDPPKVLYGFGDPGIITPGLGIIGARKATPYGTRCARAFGSWSARAGIPVVSGAALGCDHAALESALDAEGPTVAVLGCGADLDYPLRSAPLLGRMRLTGVVLSELPWGTQPKKWTFARRNRIIAGLSRAVLVVEAALPSGTFSTADQALDAGRDVYAVPGSIYAPECRGSNRLIRQGAVPITCVSDLSQELAADRLPPDADSLICEPSGLADRVVAAARAHPSRPDDLAHDLGMSINEVAIALSRHERSGALVRYRDGRYGPG